MLEAIAVCAPMSRVAERVRERCGDLADRVSLLAHWSRDPEPWAEVARVSCAALAERSRRSH